MATEIQKIIILDFSNGNVHVFDFDPNIYIDGEHFISENEKEGEIDFRLADCQWMITNSLNIQIH